MSAWAFRRIAVAVALASPIGVFAERASQQHFRVHVPPRVSIKAPPIRADAVFLHGEAQVQFAQQSWEIAANTSNGATVRFATEHSFHNLNNTGVRRDALLELIILKQSSLGAWNVIKPSAVTRYQFGQETAAVQVRSLKPGAAELGLTVTFLQGDALSTPAGDYEMTVIGMIMAN